MAELIDFYEGIIKFDNVDIPIVVDNDDVIWFYAKKIMEILGYKDIRKTIRQLQENIKTVYEDIKEFSKYKSNIQDHTVFINEAGLYEITMKARLKTAERFRLWIFKTVIPTIRRTGRYEMSESQRVELDELNLTLDEYKKRVKVLENNQRKERYPEGGYVYIVKPVNLNDDLYKIGKTNDLNKRLSTYNTTVPDKVMVVDKLKVESPIAVEHCVKAYLYKYRYMNNKEYYNIDPETIMKIIKYCAETIDDDKKILSRAQPSISINHDNELYGILAVTKEQELDNKLYEERLAKAGRSDQTGGTIYNNDLLSAYIENKRNYLALKLQ